MKQYLLILGAAATLCGCSSDRSDNNAAYNPNYDYRNNVGYPVPANNTSTANPDPGNVVAPGPAVNGGIQPDHPGEGAAPTQH